MSHVDKAPTPSAVFRIMDLFAGPGGLDVAAEVLGHRVTGIEWDENACATRAAAGMDTFAGDVRKYRAAFFPHAHVLTGGPPCQTFTVAGHGAGRRALDEVIDYIERLLDAVRAEDREWKEIFRIWRTISEELRRKAVLAQEVRGRKREAEGRRTTLRKSLRKSLAERGNSAQEVEALLRKFGSTSGTIDTDDSDLKSAIEQFSALESEIDAYKIRLEELGDERTGLVLQPLWWVIERSRRPGSEPYAAVVLEQVPAVMPVWKKYAEVLAALGYRTRTQLMLTEAFGVPQTRKRAVLMARLGKTDLPKVAETHERYRPRSASTESVRHGQEIALWDTDARVDATPKASWVSMETALKKARGIAPDLPDRPAFTVVSNYGTGGDPGARGRRDHDAPSSTITGKVSRNRLVHQGTDTTLSQFDRFTVAEAGVLQTFPVAYPWSGGDQSQQIGNAVPPRLALHVLRHVLEPELTGEAARARLEVAAADLEAWQAGKPVKAYTHKDLAGHPLTGR
ncbi:DNA cytosine methyltransferase [Streptomyces sp. NPDC048674]|uniref:DNA cytosine methyltransferase n=1 Tax=Streptomyces sp. NPDC048674 TaxID=3155491 RepID=UPI003420A8D2